MRLLALLLLMLAFPARAAVVVGSKAFTESLVLAEMAKQSLEDAGVKASHRPQLGGTRILWDALRAGEIDVYPEYTGTLRYEILAGKDGPDDAALARALGSMGIRMSAPIGFSDSYGLAMRSYRARALGIRTISDLIAHPALRYGISNEFVDRADGWGALAEAYGLPTGDVRGMVHDLAYRALASGQVDVIDVYTTDPQIRALGLVLLEDDRSFFPAYDAVYVYRADLPPAAVRALGRLKGVLDEDGMRRLNEKAQLQGVPESEVAADFLSSALAVEETPKSAGPSLAERLWQRTLEHLGLVVLSLGAALVVAVPLGIVAARRRRFGAVLLGFVGVLQTIPALALFVVLIPLLGIGAVPTIVALFLYSLLPVVRNTFAGLTTIPGSLLDSADALGLSRMQRLRLIELPLAAPTIMAGVKTAAVTAVGLATLGAIIGSGGYGQPILTGIRLNDTGLILEGAIPAALLALTMQGLFDLAERWITPRGLRIGQARQ